MGFLSWFTREKPKAAAPRKRSFDGAMHNRLVTDWITTSASMDAEIRRDLKKLRERSRDLARNNDYAKNALRVITNNVVGQGITMQASVKMRRGNRMDDTTNGAIEAAWAKWKRKETCHTGGTLGFNDIERQAMHAVAESGEVFIRKVRQSFGSGRVPFALEIIEADRLDELHNEMGRNGNEIRMGVERDKWGRPVAYHFKSDHPGDYPFGAGAVNNQTQRVPAADVLHLFKQDRPGQTRGVPWLASAIMRMHHLQGYTEAEVIAARAEACRMGFITSPEDDAMTDGTDNGQSVANFEPGRIERLMPGESFTESKANRPGGQFEPFVRSMLRSMAAGIGVSYATLSRDYSDSNYSSSRLALLDDRDNWRVLQSWMIENLHRPVFEEWMDLAVLSGELNLPGYEANTEAFRAVRWIPRGWQWVDPAKEMSAFKDAVRCGFTTMADVIASQGGDIEDVMQQRQRELQMAADMDLVFDTDPGQVDNKGVNQADTPDSADVSAADNTDQAAAQNARSLQAVDAITEQVRSLRDDVRDLRMVQMARPEPAHAVPPQVIDTSSLERAARALEDAADRTVRNIAEGVQNLRVMVPEVRIENIIPEVRSAAPTVNVVNQVQPAEVTVLDNHPIRAEQTVVRDKNDEIVKTVTEYVKG